MAGESHEGAGEGMALLARVRVVLVEPSHPGNIGAVARAMKTMGLRRLALVNPRAFPSAEATARASGADDLLVAASLHETLALAIADCAIVIGTTARPRHLEWPVVTPRTAATWLAEQTGAPQCALVFGREQAGLTNGELALCQRVIRIPTESEFSSLNLAQAVQLCAYEIRLQALLDAPADPEPAPPDDRLATADELAALVEHLQALMATVDYFDPERPKLLPRRLRRLFNRAALLHSEAQILRGFLNAAAAALMRQK